MPRLHLPVGLPGSGKSTLARELAATGAAHVALDAHRRRLWPECPPSWDPYTGRGLLVQEAFEAEVAGLLAAGRDVVADRTNLHPEGVRRLAALGARLVVHDLRRVPLAVCVGRDAVRPVGERVGEAGIRDLWLRWIADGGHPAMKGPSGAPSSSLAASGPVEAPRVLPDAPGGS